MQVVNCLLGSLLLLSTVSTPALAGQYRHIADPLNLSDSLYAAFDGDIFKIGGSISTASQQLSGNTNTAGDIWHVGYLYSSSSQWNIRASVDRGETATLVGKTSHYEYQLGVIYESQGWYNSQIYTEVGANHLAVKSHTDSTAANANITVLRPITDQWYTELYAKGSAGVDGVERFDAKGWIALGFEVDEQWSWVVRYQYDWEKLENIETEDTQWVFAVSSQF
ncbi:hypothetical protein [Shewanella youngdeokensis]|uniref:Outer membrane protein beta-barrel domain-containing protein n=1 Tax=Shewanella youngdeokensis TaxID=2999068 RepID=A0ABZ0K443_9GAMM|nr:hypothetical protein RGE70_07765 [Shewanella sp. DAU334]